MSEHIAVPAASDLLRGHLLQGGTAAELALPLRALQQRGLSQLDLALKIERVRAQNDVLDKSEEVEDRCLLALDLVHGYGSQFGLRWDAGSRAAILLARAVSAEHLASAIDHALAPSDLLPPRTAGIDRSLKNALATATVSVLEERNLIPAAAWSVRVPKRNFTSRPAAVMGFPERVALEALATQVEPHLARVLPLQVAWPRGRADETMQRVFETVQSWESSYIAKGDVANFYEAVDHTLLAVLLSTRLGVNSLTSRAIEALLTATMGLGRGLPQGPPGSDIFASAYLAAVDQELAASGLTFLRFADDYYFPADTVGEGRASLTTLERLLDDVGLSLSADKSSVMGASKFDRGIHRPDAQAFKRLVIEERLSALEAADDHEEQVRLANSVGLPEQATWDLLYHHSVDSDDLLEAVLAEDVDAVEATYCLYLHAVATSLLNEARTESLADLARVAREALAVLAHGGVAVSTAQTENVISTEDLRVVQRWFPEMTPLIIDLLVTRPHEHVVPAAEITARLRSLTGDDWVDAWAAFGAGVLPAGAVSARRLQAVLRSPLAGPLTKSEAARALLRHGRLSQRVWRAVSAELPPPLRSEFIFGAIVEPARPSWLRHYAGEALSPGLEALRQRLSLNA